MTTASTTTGTTTTTTLLTTTALNVASTTTTGDTQVRLEAGLTTAATIAEGAGATSRGRHTNISDCNNLRKQQAMQGQNVFWWRTDDKAEEGEAEGARGQWAATTSEAEENDDGVGEATTKTRIRIW